MTRAHRIATRRAEERGFTLLEVLVAGVIAALALTVLIRGALGSLRSVQVSTRYEEAVSRAQSHLAAVDAQTAIVPGSSEGDDGGGFRWRLRIVPVAAAPLARGDPAAQSQGPRVALYAVEVVISREDDDGTRAVRLATERVAVLPPAPR